MKPLPVPSQRRALVVLLASLAVFELALGAGAPFGAAAWGGGDVGVVTPGMRVASAVSGAAWGAVAAAVATGRPRGAVGARVLLRATAAVAAVGCVLNLLSPSLVERLVWVPVSATIAVLAWLLSTTPRRSCPAPPGPGW